MRDVLPTDLHPEEDPMIVVHYLSSDEPDFQGPASESHEQRWTSSFESVEDADSNGADSPMGHEEFFDFDGQSVSSFPSYALHS
jgi:hypothetical protein